MYDEDGGIMLNFYRDSIPMLLAMVWRILWTGETFLIYEYEDDE